MRVESAGSSLCRYSKCLASGIASLLVATSAPAQAESSSAPTPTDGTTDPGNAEGTPVESSIILVAAPETQIVTTTAPWYTDKLGDALVGGGIVLGVASALLYSSALSDRDSADTVIGYDRYGELVEQSQTKQNYALGFAVGATALVAAGVVSYIVRDRKVETRTVSAAATRQGGMITWSARF